MEPQSIEVKLRGGVGSLQLSCGENPNLVCIVRGREKNMVVLTCWRALCLHTALMKMYFPLKGRNFGNTSLSPSTPLVVISHLYFVLALVLCCFSYRLSTYFLVEPKI